MFVKISFLSTRATDLVLPSNKRWCFVWIPTKSRCINVLPILGAFKEYTLLDMYKSFLFILYQLARERTDILGQCLCAKPYSSFIASLMHALMKISHKKTNFKPKIIIPFNLKPLGSKHISIHRFSSSNRRMVCEWTWHKRYPDIFHSSALFLEK